MFLRETNSSYKQEVQKVIWYLTKLTSFYFIIRTNSLENCFWFFELETKRQKRREDSA